MARSLPRGTSQPERAANDQQTAYAAARDGELQSQALQISSGGADLVSSMTLLDSPGAAGSVTYSIAQTGGSALSCAILLDEVMG